MAKKYYYATFSYMSKEREGCYVKEHVTGCAEEGKNIIAGIFKTATKYLGDKAHVDTIQVDSFIEINKTDCEEIRKWERAVSSYTPTANIRGDDPVEAYLPATDEVKEERKHPIFDDCEETVGGEVKHTFMLSLNGMYISGITHEQLKELAEAAALELHPEAKKMAEGGDADKK